MARPEQQCQNLKSPRNAPAVFRLVAYASCGNRCMELVARERSFNHAVICNDCGSQQPARGSPLGYVAVALLGRVVTHVHQIAAPPATPFVIDWSHRVEEHNGVDAPELVSPVPSVHIGDGSLPSVHELVPSCGSPRSASSARAGRTARCIPLRICCLVARNEGNHCNCGPWPSSKCPVTFSKRLSMPS